MSQRMTDHIRRLQAHGWDFGLPWRAVELIARSEDCRLTAYQCIAGVWTIGWGETDEISQGMTWTADQADARFMQQLRRRAARVQAMCTVEPDENQLGAMVSLSYNIGQQAFARSTVLKRHNESDFQAAARAFALWNKARVNGVLAEVAGLTARRSREAAMYLEPVGDAPRDPMPQAVEPESQIAKSPMVRDGAIAAGSGVLVAAPTVADQIGQASGLVASVQGIAKQVSEFVGVPPLLIVAGVLVYVGFNEIRWRRRQRDGGWA